MLCVTEFNPTTVGPYGGRQT